MFARGCGCWEIIEYVAELLMIKTCQVSVASREIIIGPLVGKHGVREIGRMLSLPYSTVSYISRKWRRLKTTANLKRSGRPSHVTERDLRKLKKTLRSNRSELLKRIAALFNLDRDDPLSVKTISCKMHSMDSKLGQLAKTSDQCRKSEKS